MSKLFSSPGTLLVYVKKYDLRQTKPPVQRPEGLRLEGVGGRDNHGETGSRVSLLTPCTM